MSDEKSESSTEEVVEETQEESTEEKVSEEDKKEPQVSEDETNTNNDSTESVENTVPYSRFKEINDKLKDEKAKNARSKNVEAQLGVDEFIDISTSLEGLDQREKEYVSREHKLSGSKLSDIRNSEDFKLWDSAYKAKVEKDKLTLKPSGKQSESDKPMSLVDKLANASIEEKEKILIEAGRYKNPRRLQDRVKIGG